MHRVLAVMATLVAALALVACGGDDEGGAMSAEDYKKESQAISDKVETDFQSGIENAKSDDPNESLTGVRQIGNSANEAAGKLDELEPPEEFKGVHGQLVGSLRTLSQRADSLEQAVDQKDEARAKEALTSFQQSLSDVDKIGTEYDKKVGTT